MKKHRFENKGRNILYFSLLFLLIVFHFVNNYFWLRQDSSYQGCDVVLHLNGQLRFYYAAGNILALETSFFEKIKEFFWLIKYANPTWPRFTYLVASLADFLFGKTPIVTICSNIFFLFILIYATYLIAEKSNSKESGLLAAFIISMSPAIWGLSRKFGLDLPLIAMTVAAMYFLIASHDFKKLGYSILFGISFGLGMLTKFQIVLFVLAPISYILLINFFKIKKFSRRKKLRLFSLNTFFFRRALNFFAAMTVAALMSLPWWQGKVFLLPGIYFKQFFSDFRYIIWDNYREVSAAEGAFFYLFAIIAAMSVPLFLAFIGALLNIKRCRFKHKIIHFLWIVFPYLIFTINHIKLDRYIFPVLPAFALLTAYGILSVKRKILKNSLVIIAVFISLSQFFAFSYNPNFILSRIPAPLLSGKFVSTWVHPPLKNNYEEAVDTLLSAVKEPYQAPVGIIRTKNEFCVNKAGLIEYWILLKYFPKFLPYAETASDFYYKFKNRDMPEYLIFADVPGAKTLKDIISSKYRLCSQRILEPEMLTIYLAQRQSSIEAKN